MLPKQFLLYVLVTGFPPTSPATDTVYQVSETDRLPSVSNARQSSVTGFETLTSEEPPLDIPACSLMRRKLRGMSYTKIKEELSKYRLLEHDQCTIIYTCKLETVKAEECPVLVDGIGTCFPSTPAGKTATASCPSSLSDIPYDTSKNVTRICGSNGTWSRKSNYSECTPILDQALLLCSGVESYVQAAHDSSVLMSSSMEPCKIHYHRLAVITYVGRGISVASLIIAFLLFWLLRSIRCWRNIIHWNLVTSFILRNIFWILLRLLIDHQSRRNNTISCRVLVTLFNYTQVTNYFWMFVEGLYLHMMIVLAYTHERIKLEVYLAIGWGVPLPLILLWGILKISLEDKTCWMPDLQDTKAVEYFIQIPIFLILLVNAVILGNIVRILLTKLRAGFVSGGTKREFAEYRKAVKAALFLLPLLGVTYVIFLFSPSQSTGQPGRMMFLYCNAFLQSFQGFFVCVIYCFANDEIQKALMKKLNLWRWQRGCPCRAREEIPPTPQSRISTVSFSRTSRALLHVRGASGNTAVTGFVEMQTKSCHTDEDAELH